MTNPNPSKRVVLSQGQGCQCLSMLFGENNKDFMIEDVRGVQLAMVIGLPQSALKCGTTATAALSVWSRTSFQQTFQVAQGYMEPWLRRPDLDESPLSVWSETSFQQTLEEAWSSMKPWLRRADLHKSPLSVWTLVRKDSNSGAQILERYNLLANFGGSLGLHGTLVEKD